MNDDRTQPADERAAGPMAGERLAEARRLRQVSLPDVARELHLDEPKVQALEENRFEVLGAPVFARGHLRKYAEMVGVPVAEIMADYNRLIGGESAPPIVGEPRAQSRDIDLVPWVIGVPLVLMVLGALYWWTMRVPGSAQAPAPLNNQTVVAPQSVPVMSEPEPQTDPEPESVPLDATAGTALSTLAGEEEQPVAEADATEPVAAVPSPGEITLALTYSGDCWTEVTDAAGNRLFFDLGRAGRTVSVTGDAPFRVLLGDSGNVALRVNGQPYPLTNVERRGDTARFTINQ